jgi:hypothetical protein
VDGYALRWRVSDRPSPPNPEGWVVQLTVFSTDGGSCRLLAGSREFESDLPWKLSLFQPHHVEEIVRRALDSGWEPRSRAPDFRLDEYAPIIRSAEEARSPLRNV